MFVRVVGVLLSLFSLFQILFSQYPPMLNRENNGNAVYVLGHKYILGPSQSSFYPSAKMSLSQAQNISFPANIISIVLRRCDTAQVFVHLVS